MNERRSFKRYFELTEVAEKNDSFFLDHEEIKTIGFNGIRTRRARPSMLKPCEKISRLSLNINPRSTSPNFGVLMCSCALTSQPCCASFNGICLKSDVKMNVERNESWNWILEPPQKSKNVGTPIAIPHSEVFRLLLDYEQVVLFNTFEAYTRALDTISRCHSRLSQINSGFKRNHTSIHAPS